MPEDLARAAELALGALFAWAATAKLVNFPSWNEAVASYGLPSAARTASAFGVPLAEISTSLLLLAGAGKLGAALSLTLLSLFSVAILRARTVAGTSLPCGCFGKSAQRDYRAMLARNGLLAALAALVLLNPDRVGDRAAPDLSQVLPVALTTLGIVLTIWLLAQLAGPLRPRRR